MEYKMKLGLLVSGGLGADILRKIKEEYEIVFVMTDKQSTEIIEFSNNQSLPIFVGNPREKVFDFILDKKIEVLVSVNYLFLIDKQLIDLPTILAFNIHGSLLPKYRGRTPHIWAIINNESVTGITAHVIDEGCDTGPIINQVSVPIDSNETGNEILEKFKQLYYPLVKDVLAQIKKGNYGLVKQNTSLASYFGKRTPDDGKINWDWQKERIRNWVRAQASPYPGAFSIINGNKLIVDEIIYVDNGYCYDDPNGLILSINPLLVKSPNGVVELKSVRPHNHFIKIGDILN